MTDFVVREVAGDEWLVGRAKRRPAMTSSEACKRQSSRTLFTLPLSKRKVRRGVKGCLFNSAQWRQGVGREEEKR
jgi:hypothetical protein